MISTIILSIIYVVTGIASLLMLQTGHEKAGLGIGVVSLTALFFLAATGPIAVAIVASAGGLFLFLCIGPDTEIGA